MSAPGPLVAFRLQVARDLRLAFRNVGQAINPIMFFLMVTTLFPLALNPMPNLLATVAPGVVWVAALLASLLAAENLFRQDVEDGTMEQLALTPQPLALMLLAKVFTHWLMTGLPLVIVSPIVGYALYLPSDAVPTTMIALALATPTLSLVGGTMAALTVGLKRGGGLMSLLILPVVMPALIFGARATDLAATGLEATGALNLLAALFFLALGLTPWAMASAMRISLD
jgi:heme exporter protein B